MVVKALEESMDTAMEGGLCVKQDETDAFMIGADFEKFLRIRTGSSRR